MKINKEVIFLEKGHPEDLILFAEVKSEIEKAVKLVVWPQGSKTFKINPVKEGNGVVPIKSEFIQYLKSKNWITEKKFELVDGIGPGAIDAIWDSPSGRVAIEWETGNVSSSHRAINKMATAIIEENIVAGILIIPVRRLAKYLTDRIGNFEEIQPYFNMWKALDIKRGMLAVIAIEHDEVSDEVPFIPKGKDGNAKKAPVKRNSGPLGRFLLFL